MKFVILSAVLAAVTVSSPIAEDVTPAFNARADTRFLVFTRFNPTIGQQINIDDMSTVANTHFSAARPTRILIHGWQSDAQHDVNILTTAGYLRNYDVNVIVVDWSVGAGTINYITSRNHVPTVGALIAELLDNLQRAGHLVDYSRLTIIGHSLGAHIAGFAGKRATFGRVNTIIGLDPAGPLFSVANPNNRLASGDALYVEIIHTDISQLGIGDPIGDVDFYPNGGTNMPGCLTAICDHDMAVQYFVETLNSDRLWGRRCSNLAEMTANQCAGFGAAMGGEPSNFRNNLQGIFRMPTNSNSPFGIGQF